MRLIPLILLVVALPARSAGAQGGRVNRPFDASGAIVVEHGVRVSGDVTAPYTVSPAMLVTMPRVTLTVNDHGRRVRYEGVLLSELLMRAGLLFGDSLVGPRLATSVVVEARDGYHVVIALAETDTAFSGRKVLLADRKDGEPIAEADGPLRLVVEGDRRMSRAVRQVSGIRVLRARPY